jgi:hypothetical protein
MCSSFGGNKDIIITIVANFQDVEAEQHRLT